MKQVFGNSSWLIRHFLPFLAILALLLIPGGATPAAADPQASVFTFNGHAYLGVPPSIESPAPGVVIRLYGDNDSWPSNGPQYLLASTSTNQSGAFTLNYDGTHAPYSYLHLVQVDPAGMVSLAARAPSPATVSSKSSLTYNISNAGTFDNLAFWDRSGCSELLINGNFETGSLTPWQQSGGVLLLQSGGGHIAVFTGRSATQELSQTFSVPAGAIPAQLAFSWLASSATPQSSDYLDALIVGPSGVADRHRRLTAEVPGMTWQQELVDLAPYAGEQITLTLRMTTATAAPPTFEVDDFSAVACVPPPPVITTPPTVQDIGTDSACITWTTDQASSSIVDYGRLAQVYDQQASAAGLVTAHSVTLTSLQPNSAYHYRVRSVDANNNQVTSQDLNFETLAPDEINPPEVSVTVARTGETFTGTATVTDPAGVDRVEFYLDGALVQTAYTAPYLVKIDPNLYADGDHTLRAVAFNVGRKSKLVESGFHVAGVKDYEPPKVAISGVTINGKFATVQATLTDNWGVSAATLLLDGIPRQSQVISPPQKSVVVKLNLDLETVNAGAHTLKVGAWDQSGNYNSLPWAWDAPHLGVGVQPNLVLVGHEAIWSQSRLHVFLTVRNVGATAAKDVVIVDSMRNFMPIANPAQSAATCTPHFLDMFGLSEAILKPTSSIPAGADRIYSYEVVPILTDPPGTPSLGAATTLSYNSMTNDPHSDFEILEIQQVQAPGSPTVPAIHTTMTSTRNSLIVTSPHNLTHFNPDGDVQNLLGNLAQLASVRNAVLGFFSGVQSFIPGISKDDGLAVGHVMGGSTAQVVIGDLGSGEVRTYSMDGNLLAHFWANYTPGNSLAAGKVMGTSQGDLIVLADEITGNVRFYGPDGSFLGSIAAGYQAYDGLAVGNVLGLSYDQVIVADASAGQVRVYKFDGTVLKQFNRPLKPRDGLAAADVNGDGLPEIIIASQVDQGIYAYNASGGLLSHFARQYQPGYSLAAGNVGWDNKAEILVYDSLYISIYDANGLLRQAILVLGSNYDRIATGHVVDSPQQLNDTYDQILMSNQFNGQITSFEPGKATGTNFQLKSLTAPGGAWSQKMDPSFTSSGYLLLVGETEIVPAFGGYTFGTIFTNQGWWSLTADVTDFPYADTAGGDTIPEIIVGRIVGNSAQALLQPVLTSINMAENQPGYGFDRSEALAASGYPKGAAGNINFKNTADILSQTLTAQGTSVQKINTPDITPPSSIVSTLINSFPYKSIIVLAGHGNTSSWDALNAGDLLNAPAPFAPTHPVVLAVSCKTARYTDGISLAEAFLYKGAAAYIGETQSGVCDSDGCHTEEPFFQFWTVGETIGQGYKDWKVAMDNSDKKNYLRAINNLFGDPQVGAMPIGPGVQAQPQVIHSTGSESNLDVSVPDYVIEQVDDHQLVTIPGGDTLAEAGFPAAPEYQITYDLPAGQRVQDVTLVDRSGATDIPGLDLPPVALQLTGQTPGPAQPPAAAADLPEWWPESAFSWSVVQTSTGDRLSILLYPFQYTAARSTGRFYKNYTFTLSTDSSAVEILHAGTLKPVYQAGEAITAIIDLNTTQLQTSLVAALSVQALDGSAVSGGFPLGGLHQVNGPATYQVGWSGPNLPPGDYTLHTEIRDDTGTVLARSSDLFRVGVHALEIEQITASPGTFSGGDPVSLKLTISNPGSQAVTGAAVFTVLDEKGAKVYENSLPVTGLLPGASTQITTTWNTPLTVLPAAKYHVSARVIYEGSVAGPSDAFLVAKGVQLYLPLTMR